MNPILLESIRGNTVESFHRGVVCIVNDKNEIIYSLGDVNQIAFPRSAMKLFQHIPFLMSNYGQEIKDKELAIMCGSHNGEKKQTNLTKEILEKYNLSPNQLKCGAQLPELKEDKIELYKNNELPTALHNNCSGKHAGFLSYSNLSGKNIDSYLDKNHPLQQEILEICAAFYEYKKEDINIALDGCSAPIFSFPIFNMAIAYRNLVSPSGELSKYQQACQRIVKACTKHPYFVGGTKRYCTQLMEIAGDRVVGKTGADGIYCIGLIKEKIGIAIKIDDGKMGPQYHVAHSLLKQLGILRNEELKALKEFENPEILNYAKNKVGELKIADKLATLI